MPLKVFLIDNVFLTFTEQGDVRKIFRLVHVAEVTEQVGPIFAPLQLVLFTPHGCVLVVWLLLLVAVMVPVAAAAAATPLRVAAAAASLLQWLPSLH